MGVAGTRRGALPARACPPGHASPPVRSVRRNGRRDPLADHGASGRPVRAARRAGVRRRRPRHAARDPLGVRLALAATLAVVAAGLGMFAGTLGDTSPSQATAGGSRSAARASARREEGRPGPSPEQARVARRGRVRLERALRRRLASVSCRVWLRSPPSSTRTCASSTRPPVWRPRPPRWPGIAARLAGFAAGRLRARRARASLLSGDFGLDRLAADPEPGA